MPADAATTEEIPPKETIYVNNLNERIKQDELKKSLYSCFSQFGPILEIVSLKTVRMRGQAFIVFRDIESATTAVRQMQGFPFYDKPMQLAYAKTKSDASAKLDGTFELHDKAERAAKRKADREAREVALSAKRAALAAGGGGDAGGADAPTAGGGASGGGDGGEGEGGRAASSSGLAAVPPVSAQPAANLPNPILFVENLPEQVNEMMLSMLFQQFPGYKEVRLVPGKSGIAFVEFESEAQSGVAMGGLQNFKITPQNLMQISFAKR